MCRMVIEAVNLLLTRSMHVVLFLFYSVIALKLKHDIPKTGNHGIFECTGTWRFVFVKSMYNYLALLEEKCMHFTIEMTMHLYFFMYMVWYIVQGQCPIQNWNFWITCIWLDIKLFIFFSQWAFATF